MSGAGARTRIAAGYGALLLAATAGLIGGTIALVGMAAGLLVGLFGAWTLYGVVSLVKGAGNRVGVAFTVFAFIAKFPIFFAAGYGCWLLGMTSLACFTFGIVVVYSALVWRSIRSDLFLR